MQAVSDKEVGLPSFGLRAFEAVRLTVNICLKIHPLSLNKAKHPNEDRSTVSSFDPPQRSVSRYVADQFTFLN